MHSTSPADDLDLAPAIALLLAGLDGDDDRAHVILTDATRTEQPQQLVRALVAVALAFGDLAFGGRQSLRTRLLVELRDTLTQQHDHGGDAAA